MKLDGKDIEKMSKDELDEARRAIDKAIRTHDDRRRREVQQKLESMAKEHGFSLADFAAGRAKGARGAQGTPKYVHPENPSLTWTGRGRQPDWFKNELQQGRLREEMAL